MWKPGEITYFLNCGDFGEDIEATVKFNYSPSTPDVMYLKNGDPGFPGDPEEIEIVELFIVPWSVKIDVKFLSEDVKEQICAKISETAGETSEWDGDLNEHLHRQ